MNTAERLPRLEHKVTPKGDLFRLTKPGTSVGQVLGSGVSVFESGVSFMAVV